ncbi:MAG TPA: hypothetical protein VGL86_02055 [Polyangia bacterium]
MLKLVAQYARQRRIPKPTTPDGWRQLFAQFNADVGKRAAQVLGAAGDAFYDSDPIARMTRPPILMRDSGGLVDVTEPETEDSDFTQFMRDRQNAMEEAGGDDLAANVLYRQAQTQAANANSPFVNQNPPAAATSMLGSAQQVSTALGANGVLPRGPQVMLANWQDDSAQTSPVVITFAPVKTISGVSALVDAARPIGIIGFGTAAFQAIIEVDIGAGCQVQVSGSSVTASVALEGGNSGGVTDGDQLTMTLCAMLSFRTIERTTPITKSVYFDPLSGIGSHLVAVPAFAKKVWLTRNNLATVSVDIFGQDSVGERRWQYSLATTANMTDPIILDGSITNIEVVKTAGADSSAQLIFELGV